MNLEPNDPKVLRTMPGTTGKPWWMRKRYLVLIALFLLLVVWPMSCRHTFQQRRAHALENLREAGYPTTLAELDAWYEEPRGLNPANGYLEAFAKIVDVDDAVWDELPIFPGRKEPLPAPSEALPGGMLAAVETLLNANAEALPLLHAVRRGRPCRYPIDLRLGWQTELHHLAECRAAARLLAVEAFHRSHGQEPEAACRAFEAAFAIGASLKDEPIIISQLVRVACTWLTIPVLQDALNRVAFTDEQLVRLDDALAALRGTESFSRAIAAEMCVGNTTKLSGIEGVDPSASSESQDTEGAVKTLGTLYEWSGLHDRDMAFYLDMMALLLAASQAPYGETEGPGDHFDVALEEMRWHDGILAAMLLPAMGRSLGAQRRDDAVRLTARAAVAAQRYRTKHGSLPETLDALCPRYLRKVPTDPFDGQPLRYALREGGAVVYSVGHNRVDDGGVQAEGKAIFTQGDFTFELFE